MSRGTLSPRVLNDPMLHQAELDRIFTHCWVFVGHVSEIPSPGDYVLRYVGEDQFILVRDEEGKIRLLLNNCVHRASPVCRAEKGNASHFRCPYHGWIYKNSGDWNGAPQRTRAYRKLDAKRWGLCAAPHVDEYQGLIFACLDPDCVSLREYLGDMCWYLDILFGVNEDGMQVVGDPHRWVVPANWKSGAENFVGDGYHFASLHRSVLELGLAPPNLEQMLADASYQIAVDGGHGCVGTRMSPSPPWGVGYPPEVAKIFDLDRLTTDQREFVETGHGVQGFTIFPNLSLISSAIGLLPGRQPVRYNALRQWQPRGPEHFELWSWPLVWKAAPAEFNEQVYNVNVRNFSSSGIVEQDDTVAWRGGPPAGRSPFARRAMKLNFQMGMDGMSDCETMAEWPWPGQASSSPFCEFNQRQYWQRWRDELARLT